MGMCCWDLESHLCQAMFSFILNVVGEVRFFFFFFLSFTGNSFYNFFFTLTEYKTGTLEKVNKLLLKNTAKHKVLSKLFLMYAI